MTIFKILVLAGDQSMLLFSIVVSMCRDVTNRTTTKEVATVPMAAIPTQVRMCDEFSNVTGRVGEANFL